jgi:uncharacterized protein
MTKGPSIPGESDDVDELYRRMSQEDASGPSESVRRAVLEHATRLAADNTGGKVISISAARPRRQRIWWAAGTAAAAGLAGLMIVPQFLPLREAAKTEAPPNSVAQRSAAAPAPAAPAQNAAGGAPPVAAENVPAATQSLSAAPGKISAQPINPPDALIASNAPMSRADSADAQTDLRRVPPQASSGASASALAAPAARARSLGSAEELQQAATVGDLPALRAALERGPAIDARDASGRTALMSAVLNGRSESVDALLAAGADPNVPDASGMTPLQAAVKGGQDDIAATLRRAGGR